MPVTLHFQSTGTVPGNARPVTMIGPSLTIGRGDENDLVLPDPDKSISKRHCAIEDHGGNILVIDLSSNGTFLNYGKMPLGNVATPLNDGDILAIGSYELMVEITSGRAKASSALLPPLEDGPVSPGRAAAAPDLMNLLDDPSPSGVDFLDDLLGPATAPTGPSGIRRAQLGDDGLLPPLGADEADFLAPLPDPDTGPSRAQHNAAVEDSFLAPHVATGGNTIPDEWDDLLEGIGAPEAPVPDLPEIAGTADSPFITVPPPSRPRQPDPEPDIEPIRPAPVTLAGPDTAARAFLKSAGSEHLAIPDADLVPTLSRLGHVLRIMIHGLREVLMTRTSIKSEFRIAQTRIGAGGNNPLKFSISPEQAVDAMIKPETRGYLDAVEAAEQALNDIKAHEIAMMTGMEAALKGVLKRLDPAVLEGKIETSGGIGSILKGRKARYWEVYEKMYAEIADQAENDFHEVFAKEFARAYQDQLERLK